MADDMAQLNNERAALLAQVQAAGDPAERIALHQRVAAIDHRLASAPRETDSGSLRGYFAEQEQRKLHAWKYTDLQLAEEQRAFMAQSNDSLIELYVGLVKNSALTAEDAMIIPYLLYGSADERKYLAALMMRKCGAQRVKAYHAYISFTTNEINTCPHNSMYHVSVQIIYKSKGGKSAAMTANFAVAS